MFNSSFKNKKENGFTLVEMIVALGIFSIVALVAVGALTRIVGLNRQAQALESSVNNLSFVLDSINREVRVGSTYYCGSLSSGSTLSVPSASQNCAMNSAGNMVLAFQSSKTNTANTCRLWYAYLFTSSSGQFMVSKAQQPVSSVLCNDGLGSVSAPFTPVIATDVNLTGYRLAVYDSGNSSFNPTYPGVFLRLMGNAGIKSKDKQYFDVQTYISQRIHD